MARKWSLAEERKFRAELQKLYVAKNLTIEQVAIVLKIGPQTVFKRLKRLGFLSRRHLKPGFNNVRQDILLPKRYSNNLAEFMGVMLGDGHLTRFQIVVTLGNKEKEYADYVARLMSLVFGIEPKIIMRGGDKYRDVYFGSTVVSKWLRRQGLVYNKVASQVDAPSWIFKKKGYMKSFVRGFFDTDGSIYKLRSGQHQISLTNRSIPLLKSLQSMLQTLDYNPSAISYYHVYLTRKKDLGRFAEEIGSSYPRKRKLLDKCVGRPVGGGSGL